MTTRFTRLAWAAAVATYLLIILGAIVRITGSGLGCGEHWPLCNGSLLPPLDLPTMIEYGHRMAAAAVTILVLALAADAWRLRRAATAASPTAVSPTAASYVAVGLLIVQILLGAITVWLSLPAWTVILHLGTAMLLLAALLVAARPIARPVKAGVWAAALGFVTVLLGALTANMGAAFSCTGFPLCNGQILPDGGTLQHVHWTHRLLAYSLAAYVLVWAVKSRNRAPRYVLALVIAQVAVAAAMVLLALPKVLQAAHVAVGAGLWAGLVLAAL
jgi:heme A synthase